MRQAPKYQWKKYYKIWLMEYWFDRRLQAFILTIGFTKKPQVQIHNNA